MKNFKNFQYKKYNLQTLLRFIYIYKKIRFISGEIIIHHSITRRETFMFLKWGSIVGWKITINWKMFNLINRILKLFAVSQYNSIELVPAKRKRRWRKRRRSLSWTFIWRGKNGKSCCFIFHPDYIPSIHLEQPWSIFLSYSWISSLSSFFSFYLKWDRKKSTNFFLYFRIRIRFSFRSFIVITFFQSITLLFSLQSFELQDFQRNNFEGIYPRIRLQRDKTRTILVNTWWIIPRECLNALLRRTIVLVARDSNRSHPTIP